MIADFIKFASERGLLIKSVEHDRWVRVPTSDHPHKKNGAYFYAGEYAHVLNWATMEKTESWQHKKDRTPFEQAAMNKRMEASRKAHAETMRKNHDNAALKAAILLRDCEMQNHAYLERKGFKEELGFVDVEGRLLIPMRDCITNDLMGVQRVEWHPDTMTYTKKMQGGMKAKGAAFRIGLKTSSVTWFVEGYATALSVSAALHKLKLNDSVMACFSDSNMVLVASMMKGDRRIFADNDKSGAGEAAAIKTGLPYCMADTVGWDANDLHTEDSLMSVCKKILEVRKQ